MIIFIISIIAGLLVYGMYLKKVEHSKDSIISIESAWDMLTKEEKDEIINSCLPEYLKEEED